MILMLIHHLMFVWFVGVLFHRLPAVVCYSISKNAEVMSNAHVNMTGFVLHLSSSKPWHEVLSCLPLKKQQNISESDPCYVFLLRFLTEFSLKYMCNRQHLRVRHERANPLSSSCKRISQRRLLGSHISSPRLVNVHDHRKLRFSKYLLCIFCY